MLAFGTDKAGLTRLAGSKRWTDPAQSLALLTEVLVQSPYTYYSCKLKGFQPEPLRFYSKKTLKNVMDQGVPR